MGELWDLYNKRREKTGCIIERETPIPKGFYHLSVSAWIRNSDGQYLMSQRHSSKKFPGFWECTGGSVLAGENSLEGAIREVKEELGIMLIPSQAQFIFGTCREDMQDFYDVWLFWADIPIELIKAQESEVANVCWMEEVDIQRLIEKKQLHPLINYYEKMSDIQLHKKLAYDQI